MLRLQVWDTGRSVPEDAQERVFRALQRLESPPGEGSVFFANVRLATACGAAAPVV